MTTINSQQTEYENVPTPQDTGFGNHALGAAGEAARPAGALRSGLAGPKNHSRFEAAQRLDFGEIGELALSNLAAILEQVAPGFEQQGAEILMLNPHRDDTSLGSFKINANTGKWADFATGDRGTDVTSLVAFLLGLSQSAAAREVAGILRLMRGGA